MTDPIVFLIRNRIKAGMIDDFDRLYRDSIPRTEAEKPGTLVQLAYLDQDATEVVILRLFPSAEAMDAHLQGADVRSKAAYPFITPVSIEIYGTPNDYTLEMIKKVAGPGFPVSVHPQFIGGLIHLKSEQDEPLPS